MRERHRAVAACIQLIDRDRLPSGRAIPSACTVRSRASIASYMRSLPQTSAMIEPTTRRSFVASLAESVGTAMVVSLHKRPEYLDGERR